ncbi:MoaD/ThiS family protein [Dehalococcoidia bacterium]|nr:MoaD/ThiS family protein [Dehalococcoidia bacterium]MCL0076158.1 MoaD/ThiS family protein [Dehalococcoidia bacterium]MCL0077285.1 MoaD/ThiS family protein [Dehalococcoidia bacterium]MCL0097899.1 MoaD/ThiS family protein [Dehalococcoidia bacterium]MCL0102679.1 MoaD/ThiS family protein [Dehalococcoidia bacterium]
MALVTVRFDALLRLRLSTDSLHVEATDVKEVIEHLEQEFGHRFQQEFAVDEKISEHCLFLLNGLNLRNLKQTGLKEGDVLHVFLPTAGG